MMLTGQHLATIPASPLAIATIRTYGTGMFLYGAVVVLQDPRRWSGPAYATATSIAEPWMWGAALAVLGAVTVIGSLLRRFGLRNVGLYGASAWFGLFGVAMLDAARQDIRVSCTGPILYATLITAMCLVARAREGRKRAGVPPSL